MTTITLPRATVEQALEALEYAQQDRECPSTTRQAIAALRAALAQAEPELSRCPQCNGPADNGFDRSFPPSPYLCKKCMAEPVGPMDVGLLEYRGNSVAFIYQKMTAYRAGIDAAWDALRAKGLHPDGKTSLANMIAKYTAPSQRKSLTEKEMYIVEEEARKNFRLAQAGPRGQMITYWDSLTPWLIRAVERAHGIKE